MRLYQRYHPLHTPRVSRFELPSRLASPGFWGLAQITLRPDDESKNGKHFGVVCTEKGVCCANAAKPPVIANHTIPCIDCGRTEPKTARFMGRTKVTFLTFPQRPCDVRWGAAHCHVVFFSQRFGFCNGIRRCWIISTPHRFAPVASLEFGHDCSIL